MTGHFVEHVLDLLNPLGPLGRRRMFGGHCLYLDGIPFAIVFDDTLYLKVDDSNLADFQAHGVHDSIRAFEKNRSLTISYYEVPPDILEDREELHSWARKAFEVALRAQTKKRTRRGTPTKR